MSTKRKLDDVNEVNADAEALPAFLVALYAVQSSADSWPFEFDLLHATHFQAPSETRRVLQRVFGSELPAKWSIKVFAKDDEGSLIGFYKETIVILSSDGSEVASLGDLKNFALLLAKRVQIPALKVELDTARRFGFSQTDVTEMPHIATKNAVFGQIADLVRKHFGGIVAAHEPLRTVMDNMDAVYSLKQFAAAVSSRLRAKKNADADSDD
jgi:hypothetical protein